MTQQHHGPAAAVPAFRTSLGTSDADTITLLGGSATDLMGKVGFAELAMWLVTQQRPTAAQVRVFEAVLVALPITASPRRPSPQGSRT